MKFIKGLIFFIIVSCLLTLFVVGGYYATQDIFSGNAKEYLIDKYDFSKYDLFGYKSIEYIYEEDTNCESEWFKKCTDDKNLERKSFIKLKNKEVIEVIEYKDGSIEDDYEE